VAYHIAHDDTKQAYLDRKAANPQTRADIAVDFIKGQRFIRLPAIGLPPRLLGSTPSPDSEAAKAGRQSSAAGYGPTCFDTCNGKTRAAEHIRERACNLTFLLHWQRYL